MALHADEPRIDVALVERLVAAQFPQYADLPVVRLESPGTTNAIYRLGPDLMARLPRRASGVDELHKSFTWLPRFAPHLPAKIPVPLAKGEPDEGYPWAWSLVAWIEGENAEGKDLPDPVHAARETVALCRCGGSADNPFCDGTHARVGFKSEKTGGPNPDRRDDYAGKAVTIHDNRSICAHAGFCTDGLPAVFRLKTEPWIDPYSINGGCELTDAAWGDGASPEHYNLCRSGGSKNKPFCDGSHWVVWKDGEDGARTT